MLKSWSKLEKILLFGSIILVSAVGIIFKSDILTTINKRGHIPIVS